MQKYNVFKKDAFGRITYLEVRDGFHWYGDKEQATALTLKQAMKIARTNRRESMVGGYPMTPYGYTPA